MQNESGYVPCEFNVIVRPDPVEDKTAGGLIKPDSTIDREKHAATKATIVAVSELAFNPDIWPEGVDKPTVGQRCLIAKHAGTFVKGDNDAEYRIVKDTDVVALIA